MSVVVVRAARLQNQSGSLIGVMRTGFWTSDRLGYERLLEKPTFRVAERSGRWGDDTIFRFARLYTNGIFPWR